MRRLPLPLNRSHFVVLIGDEGAVLAHVVGRQVRNRCYAPVPDPESAELLLAALRKDSNAPVTILVDLLEQHYRDVALPRVGALDRSKLLKRKLALTFPDNQLTGALPLDKDKDGESKELQYQFTSLPITPEFKAWIELFAGAGNPIRPISLLPMEAVGLAQALRDTDTNRPDEPRQWQLLLSRQRCSGFRQTIIQRGRLVFTRMTPSLDVEARTDELIDNIEREFASTISYLRRLSFSDADRIELTVLAEPAVCEALTARRLRIRSLRCLSPHDAAKALGLQAVADPEDGYSDILYAAWFALHPRPRLALDMPELLQSRLLNRLPRAVATACVVLAAVGAAYAGLTWQGVAEAEAALAAEVAQRDRLVAERRALEAGVGALAIAPELLGAILNTDERLRQATPDFARVVGAVMHSLTPSMSVTDMRLSIDGQTVSSANRQFGSGPAAARQAGHAAAAPRAAATANVQAAALVTVRIAGPFQSREEIMRGYRTLLDALRAALPGYSVVQIRDPFNISGNTALSGAGGLAVDRNAGSLPSSVTSDIRIVGPGG